MATYAKLLNGLTDLGIHKMQDHLDYYIELVNKGQKSFSEALEELIAIEKKNNQLRAVVGQSTPQNRKIPWNSKGFRICRDYSHSIM